MHKHLQTLLLATIVISGSTSVACTTFAVDGASTADHQTLIGKNRDAMTPYQKVAIRRDKNKIAYI